MYCQQNAQNVSKVNVLIMKNGLIKTVIFDF